MFWLHLSEYRVTRSRDESDTSSTQTAHSLRSREVSACWVVHQSPQRVQLAKRIKSWRLMDRVKTGRGEQRGVNHTPSASCSIPSNASPIPTIVFKLSTINQYNYLSWHIMVLKLRYIWKSDINLLILQIKVSIYFNSSIFIHFLIIRKNTI